MKILKTTDRVKLTLPDSLISVTIAPLTAAQKLEIASKMKIVKGEEVPDFNAQGFLCIKYAVKGIDGIEDYSGNKYELEFEDDSKKALSDSCADDVTSILHETELLLPMTYAANKALSKIKDVFVEVNPKN